MVITNPQAGSDTQQPTATIDVSLTNPQNIGVNPILYYWAFGSQPALGPDLEASGWLLGTSGSPGESATLNLDRVGTYSFIAEAVADNLQRFHSQPVAFTRSAGPGGVLAFDKASYSVLEGQSAAITVTRTGGSEGDVSVRWYSMDGTATAGADHYGGWDYIYFAAGETSKTLQFSTLDDSTVESAETLTLHLDSPTGAAALGSQIETVLTIKENDIQFQPVQNYTTGGSRTAGLVTGDFNGDGNLDVALADHDTSKVYVRLGSANGTLGSSVAYSAGTDPTTIVAADFNRDGKLDLAVGRSADVAGSPRGPAPWPSTPLHTPWPRTWAAQPSRWSAPAAATAPSRWITPRRTARPRPGQTIQPPAARSPSPRV